MKLTDSQIHLLLVLDMAPGRVITPPYICQQLTGTSIDQAGREELGEICRDIHALQKAGLVMRRPGVHKTLAITARGRAALRWGQDGSWQQRMVMFAAVASSTALLAACSMMATVDAQEKVPATVDHVTPRPAVVQKRAADGAMEWAYCYGDCPAVTTKVPYGHVPAANVAQANPPAGAATSAPSRPTTSARADGKPSSSMAAIEVRSTRYAIFFDSGSAAIGSKNRAAFDGFAPDAIRAESIELVGRTDSTGSRQANQKLAQRRAEVVRQRLVAEGVSADRITISADPESSALPTDMKTMGVHPASASSAARRVEIELKIRELAALGARAEHR